MLRKILNFIYIFLGLLLVSHYFRYSLWDTTSGPKLILVYIVFTYLYVIFKINIVRKSYDSNYKIVIWLLLSGSVTVLVSLASNLGSVDSQRDIVLVLSVIPVYFFLKARNISQKEIINAFTIYLLITVIIQVYQQINFSNPLFGLEWTDNGEAFTGYQRNDLFRFNIGIAVLGEFCLFYFWSRICEHRSLFSISFFIISAVSVYLYLTRQYMVASLLSVLISLFMIKDKKIKRWGFIGILMFSAVLVINYDIFFKELIEYSESDTYSTDIRKVAFGFIFSHVFDNPIMWLTGHGHTYDEILWTRKGLYTSDVGFVGQMYIMGIVWVIVYFYTVYKFIWKKRKELPLYLKLFVFCTLVHSPMVFPYSDLSSSFIWMVFLYLCSLEEKKIYYEKQHKI